ncbi:sialic acid-binding Ig-like lectin 7 [Trematomus bernacchii]|uniref:sialic acid-binding Ig-like lectin 7 n=1 Tax=Trematomus bernacchii TaxID=40690 RepID=UPI001469F621|nr:sialic acid-binding Ig-like lectin 7 [Trematomus bernacchii]
MSATEIVILHILFISGSMDCTDLSITAPKEMEALSGSCLHIPCTFSATEEIKIDNRIGMLIKITHEHLGEHPENVIFNSNKAKNTYPMNITGNLSENNCNTLFSSLNTSYTNKYFFRFKKKTFKATASDDPIQITVKDSPPSPTIEIPGDLKEAESVTVTCSAPAPCPHSPPKLTWTLQQEPPNTIEENPDRTFTTKIQKTLTLTDQHDGFNITCSANYPVNEGKDVKTAEETKTLHVSCDQQIGTVGLDVHLILKILGIIMLVSTMVIFEWTQQKQTVNRVVELQTS